VQRRCQFARSFLYHRSNGYRVVSVGAGVFVVVIGIGAFEIVGGSCCADALPTTSMNARDVPSPIAFYSAATWSGTPFRRCCLVDPAVNELVLWF